MDTRIASEMLNDNSDLPCNMSEKAIEIWGKTEGMLVSNPKTGQRKIQIKKVNSLDGDMMTVYEENPDEPIIIKYKDDNTLTEEGIIHELLHVELLYGKGFPVLYQINVNDTMPDKLVEMLDGQIQHCLFFPKMRTYGYNPYESEEKAIRKMLNCSRLFEKPYSILDKIWFSVFYSRVQIESITQELKELRDSRFDEYDLEYTKQLGVELENTIRQYAIDEKDKYNKGLEVVVKFLGLEGRVGIKTLRPQTNND